MIPRGLVSDVASDKDEETVMLEKKLRTLRRVERKDMLREEVRSLESKYGSAISKAIKEDPSEKFWAKRGIKVTDMRRTR